MIYCSRAPRHSGDTYQCTYRFTILYACLKHRNPLIYICTCDPGTWGRYCTITVMTYCAWHCLSCWRVNQGIRRMSGCCIHVGKTYRSSSRSPILVIANMWLEAQIQHFCSYTWKHAILLNHTHGHCTCKNKKKKKQDQKKQKREHQQLPSGERGILYLYPVKGLHLDFDLKPFL